MAAAVSEKRVGDHGAHVSFCRGKSRQKEGRSMGSILLHTLLMLSQSKERRRCCLWPSKTKSNQRGMFAYRLRASFTSQKKRKKGKEVEVKVKGGEEEFIYLFVTHFPISKAGKKIYHHEPLPSAFDDFSSINRISS